jgi:shikimate dehydrogenase
VSSRDRTRLAVLGSPIAHSKSPTIHRAAYAALGLDWSYEAIEMTGERLAGFVDGCDASWRGLSLTMPLKRDVIPLLAWRHPLVDRVGGANTVLFAEDGPHGFNTDVPGIVQSFADVGVSSLRYAHVLGAGATAASVLVAAAELGAQRVLVSARQPERAVAIVDLGERLNVEVTVRGWGIMDRSLIAPDAIISTVPGGTSDYAFAEQIRRQSVLFDVAYEPWPTALAAAWAEVGGTVISGLDLLVNQAVGQVRVFLNGDPTIPLPGEADVVAAMRAAVA